MLPFLPAWFLLRFITGMAGAVPWVVSETWLNMVATERDRGRIMGIYATVLAAGFAIGPAIIGAVGAEGWLPFLIVALAVGLSILPILLAKNLAPAMPERSEAPLSDILRAQPLVMTAALCGGVMDFALFALLPVYGLRHGLDQASAVFMITVFIGGNVLLQIPIGWLADHTNRLTVLFACILFSLMGALLLPLAISQPILLYWLVFFWGGSLFAIYTIGLGLLGDGFPRVQLAAANVVFVMVYEIGSAGGPTLAGTAIDVFGPEGLTTVVAIAATALAVAFIRLRPGSADPGLSGQAFPKASSLASRCWAVPRSSCPPPPDLKKVISSSFRRPGFSPRASSNVSVMSESAMMPLAMGWQMSPAWAAAVKRASTKMRQRRTASSSASRISSRKPPTRSRCWPGRSQRPWIRGVGDMVAAETMSASLIAASMLSTA